MHMKFATNPKGYIM